ncbi:ABC transporter permease [Herpetosiphon giganteus]|uniref:ABC transporter permease n=1 Tax=Herpetosiphon giganteus TaxID=2029754 RepID=UPI001958E6F2|nr:ABC transporter permease [Herpetosiphon giganteus]MBM7843868.1 ABC-2 type transport system permease protein [Herpetosiphon giganteus]
MAFGRSFWRETRASYAFVERNINLIKRYWGWEVVWLIYSIVNALSITFIGKAVGAITGQEFDQATIDATILYLIVGTLVWHYLAVVFDCIAESVQWERWEGTIEYTFMAPISRLTHMLGTTIFAVFWGLFHTGIILAFVAIFFQISLDNANFLGATVILLTGSISFIGLGIVAAVLPLLFPERGAQMTNIVKATILLVSGVYYPISVLPTWMQPLASISPATYVLEGMRRALQHNAGPIDLWWNYLLPLLGSGLLLVPLGLWIFLRGEDYAKRTGRLKRNG